MDCLRLLREQWLHAVRGNHEDMLIEYAFPQAPPYAYGGGADQFFGNGGRRVLALSTSDRNELWGDLVPRVAILPYVITVGEGSARFHIAHAELMTGRVDESTTWYNRLDGGKKAVLTDTMINEGVLSTMVEPHTWGRRLVRKARDSKASDVATPYGKLVVSHKPWHPGFALIYVGHTPVKSMVLHTSHLFIDRGAYTRKQGSCLLVLDHQEVRERGDLLS